MSDLRTAFRKVSGWLPSSIYGPTARAAGPRDFRAAAKARLPEFFFRYIEGAAGAGQTFRRNEEALQEIPLRQNVLAGVSEPDTSVEILGRKWSMPLGCAPVGLAGMYAHRGEVQGARAAEKMNVPFALSTVGVCTIDEVAQAVKNPFWFQLYVIRDRGCMRELLQEAKGKCDTLLFTVDMPVPGKRYEDARPGGLAYSMGLKGQLMRAAQAIQHPHWAVNVGLLGTPHMLGNVAPFLNGKTGMGDFFKWMRDNFDPTIDWKILEEIREQWDGKLVIKGVMNVDDAEKAVTRGVDGVLVDNHGGRQMAGVPGVADVLPAISRAIRGKTTVLAAGGVRDATDLMRMLVFADGALVGRPWVYALAAEEQAGVERYFKLMQDELKVQMTLAGVSKISEISTKSLMRPEELGWQQFAHP